MLTAFSQTDTRFTFLCQGTFCSLAVGFVSAFLLIGLSSLKAAWMQSVTKGVYHNHRIISLCWACYPQAGGEHWNGQLSPCEHRGGQLFPCERCQTLKLSIFKSTDKFLVITPILLCLGSWVSCHACCCCVHVYEQTRVMSEKVDWLKSALTESCCLIIVVFVALCEMWVNLMCAPPPHYFTTHCFEDAKPHLPPSFFPSDTGVHVGELHSLKEGGVKMDRGWEKRDESSRVSPPLSHSHRVTHSHTRPHPHLAAPLLSSPLCWNDCPRIKEAGRPD